jgi:hypothetical protein
MCLCLGWSQRPQRLHGTASQAVGNHCQPVVCRCLLHVTPGIALGLRAVQWARPGKACNMHWWPNTLTLSHFHVSKAQMSATKHGKPDRDGGGFLDLKQFNLPDCAEKQRISWDLMRFHDLLRSLPMVTIARWRWVICPKTSGHKFRPMPTRGWEIPF